MIELGSEARGVVDKYDQHSPSGVWRGGHGGVRRCAWVGGARRGIAGAVKVEVAPGYAGKGVAVVTVAAERSIKGLRLPFRKDKGAEERVCRVGGGGNCVADGAE